LSWETMYDKREGMEPLLNRFRGLPLWAVSMAYAYAFNIAQYGVDASEKWETITKQQEMLDRAYRKGRYDEAARWRGKEWQD